MSNVCMNTDLTRAGLPSLCKILHIITLITILDDSFGFLPMPKYTIYRYLQI